MLCVVQITLGENKKMKPTTALRSLLLFVSTAFMVIFTSGAAIGDDVDPWLKKLTDKHVVNERRYVQVSQKQAAELTAAVDWAIRKFNGKIKPEDARVMLSAIALHESDLAADVIACKRFGDGGRAVGAFQQHLVGSRKKAVCEGGLPSQAYYALLHLNTLLEHTKDGNLDKVLHYYAGGNPGGAELVKLTKALRQ